MGLKKQLKKSVKAAKKGDNGKPKLVIPVDLPKGVKMTPEGEFVLPDSPAQCADLLHKTKHLRYDLQHRVDRLQSLQTKIEQYFIETLPMSDATGIAGQFARVQIMPDWVPQVEDWDAVWAYVVKYKAFEIIQRRLTEKAVKERLEEEKSLPGIVMFNRKKVSCQQI